MAGKEQHHGMQPATNRCWVPVKTSEMTQEMSPTTVSGQWWFINGKNESVCIT